MKTTKNLGLNMPDANDFVEIDKINKNTEKIDEELAKKADASGGDISETVITSTETSQAEYPVPAAGDSAKIFCCLHRLAPFCHFASSCSPARCV